jgi:hypothetical protein
MGSLLVSLYIMALGGYVQAEDLGVSEFCPVLVVFPARCVFSISARFLLYRAQAICFPALVTILECLKKIMLSEVSQAQKAKNHMFSLICGL